MEKRIKLIIEGQDRASASIQSAQRSLLGLGSTGRSVLGGFLAWQAIHGVFNIMEGAVGALGGAIADTASAGMDFNQQMSKIAAVADTDAQSLDRLRQKAMELGRDTVYTTNEAGLAIEELIKAGVQVPVVLDGAAEATVALASAGGLALDESALIISKAINSFQLGGEQAMMVADVMSNAANASATNVHNMGEAMKYAAPLLQSLTGPAYDSTTALTELATANALLSQSGIDASMAGAGLQRMLEGLTPNSEKAKGIMEDLGLITAETGNRFFDAEGNFIGLKDAVMLLDDAFVGLTQEEKMTAMEAMFGQRAGRVLNNLLNQLGDNAEGWDAMYAAVTDEGGAAEAAATKLDNLRGRLEFLQGSIEYIQTNIWTDEFENRLTAPFESLGVWLGRIGDRLAAWDVQSTLYVFADALAKIGQVAIDQWAPGIISFLDDVGKEESRVAIRDLGSAIEDLIITLSGGEKRVPPSIEGTVALMNSGGIPTATDNTNSFADAIRRLTGVVETIDGFIQGVKRVEHTINQWASNMQQWGENTRIWVYNTSQTLNRFAVNAVNEFVNHPVWTDIGNIPSKIAESWNNFKTTITVWWTETVTPIIADMRKWGDDLNAEMAKVPGKIRDKWNEKVGEITSAVKRWKDDVMTAVRNFDFSSAASTAAGTIVSGFVSGLSGGLGAVAEEARKLARAAIAAWRAIARSQSPSRVMIEEGQYFAKGAAIGMDNYLPVVVRSANDLAVAGIEEYHKGIQAGEEPTYSHGSRIGESYTDGVAGGVADGEGSILDSIEALWREFLDDMGSRMDDFKRWMAEEGEAAGRAFSEALADNIKVPDLPGGEGGEDRYGVPTDRERWSGTPGQPGYDRGDGLGNSAPPGGSRDPGPPGNSRPPAPPAPGPGERVAWGTTVNVYGLGYREATDMVAQRVSNDSRIVYRSEYGVL